MKKLLLICTFMGIMSFMNAQVSFNLLPTLSRPPLFGASPFQDSLWGMDTIGFGAVYGASPSLPGFLVTGLTGLTMHPHTGEYYVIMKVSGIPNRVLGKFNPLTGICTQIGQLAENKYATICFREDGQLFGVTGQGGTPAETMFMIDANTAATTLAIALGNGADGEIISYNYDDDMFYHWSGNGTMVMEKFPATAPYTPITNIVFTGSPGGETFGAAYLGSNTFMISNIGSRLKKTTTGGTYGIDLASNPDDLRGLGIVGRWVNRVGNDTICSNDSSLFEAMATSGVSDRHKFQWVLNGINIPGATSSTYYANQSGWYNCRIILDSLYTNTQTMDSAITIYTDTAWYGRSLVVNPIPSVTITPAPTAYYCSASDSVQLMGTPAPIMQWYQNGILIPGATDTNYHAFAAGLYNFMATDINGCSDTSATPTLVMMAPSPSLSVSGNTCFGDSVLLSANSGAIQYNWLLNGSSISITATDSIYVSSSGDYSVETLIGTCADTSIIQTVTFAPSYDISPNGSGSICAGSNQLLTATGGGTYQWLMNGSIIGGATSSTFSATATGVYSCIVTSPSCTDTTLTSYSLTTVDCSGIEENANVVINIYPNPVHDKLTITLSNNTIINRIEVVDLAGRKVLSTNVNSSNTSINVEELRAGAYLITIATDGGVETHRFIKN